MSGSPSPPTTTPCSTQPPSTTGPCSDGASSARRRKVLFLGARLGRIVSLAPGADCVPRESSSRSPRVKSRPSKREKVTPSGRRAWVLLLRRQWTQGELHDKRCPGVRLALHPNGST